MNDEKLREAIEWVREYALDGPYNDDVQAYMLTVADAAKRSLTVDDLKREVGELRERVASLQREADDALRNQDTLAAALSPRTRWYTPEKDGVPTDTSKHLVARWEDGDTTLANPPWIPLNGRDDAIVAYAYLDPPPAEEPLPKCWCGAEAIEYAADDTDKNRAVSCSKDCWHGEAKGTTSAEARENWCKLRGQP